MIERGRPRLGQQRSRSARQTRAWRQAIGADIARARARRGGAAVVARDRETSADHDPAVLDFPHLGAALVLHRATPALSLAELCERGKRPGPVRRALDHARRCSRCVVGSLCATGERLAATIRPRRTRQRPS